MSIQILGLGTALPPHRMSQPDALQMTHDIVCADERQRRLATMLFRKSGVEGRNTSVPHPIAYEWARREADLQVSRGPTTGERLQLYSAHAPQMAETACRKAIEAAGIEFRDVTHLVTVSCTGFDAPGVDISLFDNLGLRATAERVHVGYMGCHGAINGLRAARGLATADPGSVILVSACELCSLHYRFTWDDEGVIGNALFADGAASVVLGDPALAGEQRATNVPQNGANRWSLTATGSCLIPDSRNSMSWRIGDYGFEMRLTAEVAEHIERSLKPWISEWLARQDLSIETVDHWVVHPGGPKILDAVESALGLDPRHTALSRAVLNDHGNMSSPTVLFVLERLEESAPRGSCVLLGFGPGLMAEACLLRRS